MDLESSSGLQEDSMSVSGPLIIKMELEFCLSKEAMSMQENSYKISVKDTVTISGPTIENSKVGGLRISNMVLVFILVLNQQLLNLGFGKWVNESNGLLNRSKKVFEMDRLITSVSFL